jgi:SAM-dependent methyltransferase
MSELVYDCERARLGDALAAVFRPLGRDAALDTWLAAWGARPYGWLATQLSGLLSAFVSSYDAHGLLGGYPMHLLSDEAWGALLDHTRAGSLLDVGAGAGYVTAFARGWFDEIVCTETSRPLARRLRARGLSAREVDITEQSLGRAFDVVSAFNVLDRTVAPVSLLRSLVSHTHPGGRLLLSIPLPAAPHVHVKGGTAAPRERLPSVAPDWETAARELTERLLLPAGLRVTRLSRLPYLSRGDAACPLYVLDSALWVCERA